MKNRIVTEVFIENSSFSQISKIAKLLEKQNIKTLLISSHGKDGIHLIIQNQDIEKVRKKLKSMDLDFIEKQVVLLKLKNQPGSMARVAKKIAAKGVNLLYAFSVALTPDIAYVLLETSDNHATLELLD